MDEHHARESRTDGWRRRPGVTALRSLVVAMTLAFAGIAVTLNQPGFHDGSANGWEPLIAAIVWMAMFAVGFGFAGLVYWWVDHMLASQGRFVSAAVHTAVGFVVAIILVVLEGTGPDGSRVDARGLMLIPAAVLVATSLAGLVRGSFEPHPSRRH